MASKEFDVDIDLNGNALKNVKDPSASTDGVNRGYVDIASYGVASGTNTYVLALTPAILSYTAGQLFKVKFTNANTGASTINIDTLGAKNIYKNVSTALASGDILANQTLILLYDGTNFQILGIIGTGSGTTFPPILLGSPTTYASTPQTLNGTQGVVIGNMATALAINLPTATTCSGRAYFIKNINTGLLTITPNGAEKIDQYSTLSLSQWDAFLIYSNGVGWIVAGYFLNRSTELVITNSPRPVGLIVAGGGTIAYDQTDAGANYIPFTRITASANSSTLKLRNTFYIPSEYRKMINVQVQVRKGDIATTMTFNTLKNGVAVDSGIGITPTLANTWESKTITLPSSYIAGDEYQFEIIGGVGGVNNMGNGDTFDLQSVRFNYQRFKNT